MRGLALYSFKLLHHELAAGFVTQEKGSVSRECAHHGGGKAGVKGPGTYTQQARKAMKGLQLRDNPDDQTVIYNLPSVRAIVMKVLKKPACLPVIDMTWILDLTQSMG